MIAYLKWGGIAAAFLGWSWLCYHQGSLAPKLKAATAEIKEEQTQIQQEAKQLQTNTQAEAQHDQDTEHPTILILRQPVWLRTPALSTSVSVPAATANPGTAIRPADAGPTVDLRPQLAAFALKYENALSDCRRMAAEWPQ
jgi:hypothetical protein